MSNAVHIDTEERDEGGAWPRGVSREPAISIGEVVSRLRLEFPAVTSSKIRFLEDQGLVSPARTGSGYRKYSLADIERLRLILTRQRDSFAPLKVIGEELRGLDAGHEVDFSRSPRVVASEGKVVSSGNRRALPARDLCDLTGVDISIVERYVSLGIITPDIAGYFPARSIEVIRLLAELESMGLDARLLRSVRTGAERSADIIDQTVSSQRSRKRSGDRERAHARSVELGELMAKLHLELLRISVGRLNEGT
ncbi:MerR family transcriptional regulator [Schaalia sp. ZJ405]|uniref:transcriptional regulator FtsR n=1 Tax=unclassified Schaalia TaxID=2691889 RepID=UPI0013EBE15B|nr:MULTISPECIES: MerR family transcriptional regulator [unclassified Schaalia]QPK80454.1 MerR family transcriptional regulator [Schaalia sp. ZJ405]